MVEHHVSKMQAYQKVIHFDKPENGPLEWEGTHVEEKLDGSMVRIYMERDGTVVFGSHHKVGMSNMSGQFARLAEQEEFFRGLAKRGYVDWDKSPITVFCEFIPKKRSNVLVYGRTPERDLVVFDIYVHSGSNQGFLRYDIKQDVCVGWGLECVQSLDPRMSREDVLKQKSMLGGQIEGVVKKDYGTIYDVNERHSLHGFTLMGKVVNAEFMETFRKDNSNKTDFIQQLSERYASPARYQKAYQAVEPVGPKDIPKMLAYAAKDIEDEEGGEIRELLWKRYGPSVIRKAIGGLPKWYMDEHGNKVAMG